jgi:hypothetical protein
MYQSRLQRKKKSNNKRKPQKPNKANELTKGGDLHEDQVEAPRSVEPLLCLTVLLGSKTPYTITADFAFANLFHSLF